MCVSFKHQLCLATVVSFVRRNTRLTWSTVWKSIASYIRLDCELLELDSIDGRY